MTFMTSRRSLTIALTAAAWGLAGPALAAAPAQPATINVQHAKGTATVPLKPQRVVVYDLAALDVMQALQLPVAGVAKAQYPDYLAAYAEAKYQDAGTLFIPDYESLSRIQPDLIVVAGRSAAKYEVLAKIAPTLDLSVDGKQLLADMERNVTTLSSLWGQQAQGRQLMAQVRAEVDGLQAVAAQAEPGLLVLAVTPRYVPETRSDEPSRIDWRGTSLLAVILCCLLFPLALGPELHWPWPTTAALLAVIPLALWMRSDAARQQQRGLQPLLPPRLLKLASIRFGILIALLFFSAWSGFMFCMALTMQAGMGMAPPGLRPDLRMLSSIMRSLPHAVRVLVQ